jgi:hypothetical protein
MPKGESEAYKKRREADRRVEARASRQYGAVNRRQAMAEGMTRRQIDHHLATGRWRSPCRAVYVGATTPACSRQRAAIAVLSGPPETVASHLTAAALHGLIGFPAIPQVTVPKGTSGRLSGAKVRRGALPEEEVVEVQGLPATSAARTLVDCAGVVGYETLCSLVDTALFLRRTTAEEVRTAAASVPGRPGIQRLQWALEVWTPGPHPGSVPEIALIRLLISWGLPPPIRQMPVYDDAGRFVAQVDVGCPETKVIYEYDGGEFHGPRRQALDAARQARVERCGWTVVRVTKADVRRGGARLRRRISEIIGRPLHPVRRT